MLPGPEPDVAVFGRQVVEEHVLDDHALPALNPIGGFALRLEQLLQLGRQAEDAVLKVLRRAGITRRRRWSTAAVQISLRRPLAYL
jgi:hypothetical protein